MRPLPFGKVLAAALLLGLGAGKAAAQEIKEQPRDHNMQRAGYADRVHKWAIPTDTGSYVGYKVGGGGGIIRRDCPCQNDGTWGWDYSGHTLHRKVFLFWNHGRRYQGGIGAYKTDGPEVPDIIALAKPQFGSHKKSEAGGNGHE